MLSWIPLAEPHRLPAVCGLYIIRHRESGREYVGKSVNVRSRAHNHRRARAGVTYLYKALRKHGIDAFDICLFATGTEAEMTALEVEVIAARGTFNPAGYNQTRGGDGVSGYRYTAAQRAAVTARQLGRPNPPEAIEKIRAWALENNSFRGKKHKPETLEKISQTLRHLGGKPRTAAQQAHIAALNESKRGTTHSEETRKLLSSRLRGKKKPEGFGVGLHTGEKNAMYGRKGSAHPRARAVLAWLAGSFTPLAFDAAGDAAAWAGCSLASMTAYCQGTQKAKSGVLFAFAL